MKPNILVLIGVGLLGNLATPVLSHALTFTTTTYARGTRATGGIAMADVNGDGKVDLICADRNLSVLSVLTNNGTGSFVLSRTVPVAGGPGMVMALNLNSDTNVDLICQYPSLNLLTVLTNDGTGAFGLRTNLTLVSSPLWVTPIDLNGDGKLDLVTAHPTGPSGTLTLLTNDGTGGFSVNATLPTAGFPDPVLATDINGDGKPDLVTLGQNNFGIPELMIHTNNGSGVFGSNSTMNVSSSGSWIATADVNGDSKMDLLVTDRQSFVTVWTNNGSGVFGSNNIYSVGVGPLEMEIGDANGDGKPDVIIASDSFCIGSVTPCSDGTVTILTNNGIGTFGLAATLTAGIVPTQVVPIDMNGDGKADVMAVNSGLSYGPNTLSEFINTSPFPPPKLAISSSTNEMVIQWPSAAVGFTLQTNSSPGTTNWVAYAGTISDNGLTKNTTNSTLSNSSVFFRLKK